MECGNRWLKGKMNIHAVIKKLLPTMFWSKDGLFTCLFELSIIRENSWHKMCYGCFRKPSTSVQNSNYEHLRTKQTGCGCQLKCIWHSKVVRFLYICTLAHCTDRHRLTTSGKSPSVILKTEWSVPYRLCDCKQHIAF